MAKERTPSSFLLLVASLLLVVRAGALVASLLLVAMPGAPSSVLVPSESIEDYRSIYLHPVISYGPSLVHNGL